jgi:hypothetical protein
MRPSPTLYLVKCEPAKQPAPPDRETTRFKAFQDTVRWRRQLRRQVPEQFMADDGAE